jgi:hypothetical protein
MPTTDECPVTDSSVVINRENFKRLNPHGERLIWRWFERASEGLTDDPFGSFIYAWIAINGWASCCSGKESDTELVDAMASDPVLQNEFEALKKDPGYRDWAEAFRDQWPIVKVADLRREGVRQALRGPRCYERHVKEGEFCPLDLAHTLAAAYRVRCDLFHGEKSVDLDRDRDIVSAAANTLVPFLERALNAG